MKWAVTLGWATLVVVVGLARGGPRPYGPPGGPDYVPEPTPPPPYERPANYDYWYEPDDVKKTIPHFFDEVKDVYVTESGSCHPSLGIRDGEYDESNKWLCQTWLNDCKKDQGYAPESWETRRDGDKGPINACFCACTKYSKVGPVSKND